MAATVVMEDHHSPDIQPDPISKPAFPEDIDNHYGGSPIKFLPLHHVYSATSPSVVTSKKVRARKVTSPDHDPFFSCHQFDPVKQPQPQPQPRQITHVYSRRKRKVEIVVESEALDDDDEGFVDSKKRHRASELVKLGVDATVLSRINRPRLRESRFQYNVTNAAATTSKSVVKKRKINSSLHTKHQADWKLKKWFQLASDGVDPISFIGLKCKVYWPLDNVWYKATIQSYNSNTKMHNVNYDDGDEEELDLSDEQVKFHVSREEMRKLNLKGHKLTSDDDPDYSLLIALAATVDESRELEAGDIIWAKLTGYAMWPAIIMDESLVSDCKGLNKSSGGRSLPVQFFGSHDFARVQVKQIVSFLKGLSSCFHLKCKASKFIKSLNEAKVYLNEQKLPKSMLNMRRVCVDIHCSDSDEISLMDISNSKATSKISAKKKLHEMCQYLPNGYWPVNITWKDLDRCSVCHMDEEYENNLFLQCDKCRMMVHARCYGEESVSGMLWLCKLCRDGAPLSIPPCRLCPVNGIHCFVVIFVYCVPQLFVNMCLLVSDV